MKLSFSIYVSAKCLEGKGHSSAAQGWIKTTVPFSPPSPDPEKGRGSRTAHILPRVGTVLQMLQADSCPYSSWDGACSLPHAVHPTSLPMEGSPSPAPTCPTFMSAAKCAYHCQEAVGIFLMLPRAVPRSRRDCSSSGTQHKSLFTTSIGKMATLSLFCPSCRAPVSFLTPPCPSCKLCAPNQWKTHCWSSENIAVGASKAGRHGLRNGNCSV